MDLSEAVARLGEGSVIAYPTETFYGLGADARRPESVARIFALKGRAATEPLPLILPGAEWLHRIAGDVPVLAEALAHAFWPGPLTLVLSAADWIPALVHAGTGTVGVRVSSHPLASELARAAGAPLTATSANRSGAPPAQRAAEVRESFPGLYVVDGGETPGGLPSTIVDCTGPEPRLVRRGAIPWQEIVRYVADLRE